MTKPRRRVVTVAILAGTIVFGLLSRAVHGHGPLWLTKDPGDVLWGAMVYWLAASLLVRKPPLVIAGIAAIYSTATEIFKFFDPPAIHRFRMTFIGHLVLGQVFSSRDIICYMIGIGLCLGIDRFTSGRNLRASSHHNLD